MRYTKPDPVYFEMAEMVVEYYQPSGGRPSQASLEHLASTIRNAVESWVEDRDAD